MSNSYPFRFEEYPKKKGTCPQCSEPHEFRFYEDLSGNRLEDFGRCERVNECGYRRVPSGQAILKEVSPYTRPQPVQIFPSEGLLIRLKESLTRELNSAFHQYALRLGLSHAHLANWRVGSEIKGDNVLTLFIHEDGQHRITNAKWFLYEANGKRNRMFNSFSLKQPDGAPLRRYSLCLFGEHLLDPTKQRAVMLVESEKTAVISAWFYPDYDWLAVGSCHGLTDVKIPALFGRRCFWLADADKAGRSNSSINRLKTHRIRYGVLDLFPNKHDGYDLCDTIQDNQEKGTALPELLDDHQRHLITAQLDTESQSDTNNSTAENSDNQGGIPEENVEWENQVGLPPKIWRDKTHRKHLKKYGFIEHNNAYWFASRRENREAENDDTWVFKDVSNFVIKPLLLILSKSNPKRIYEVTNTTKSSKVVDLEPKQFANPAGFCEVVESQGNFVFWGTKSHFTRIKMKLFELSNEAEEIKTLGYHPAGFYAFANGIQNSQWVPLDEYGYGIVEHGDKRYFLPALSKIFATDDQEYETQKKFIYKAGEIDFKAYAQKFCDIYQLNGNGQIGLLFYITCLFRDIVFQNFRFFPHLYLFGPPQSGKSTMAWSTMCLFGQPRTPFMLNTGTAVAFYKQFAEFRNAVVWFDEYKNSIDYARVQSLKTAYDGAGHTKSENTRDNRNKSIPVHSGCIVSGQELPTVDVALFTRCLLLQFTKTDFTLEEKQLQSDFRKNIEEVGISHITAYIARFRDQFKEHFLPAFDSEFILIKDHFEKRGIDDRITKNMAILLATYQVFKETFEFPFEEDQLRQTAYKIMEAQNALITGSKETATFWKMVMLMYRTRLIKERLDYRIELKAWIEMYNGKDQPDTKLYLTDAAKAHPIGKQVLFIRLQNLHSFYEKLCRERGNKSMDEGSLRHYLTTSKGYLGKVQQIKFGKSNTSAMAFDYDYLTEAIEDFCLNDMVEEEPKLTEFT